MKKHRDWADLRNYGITHFGVHPRLSFDSLNCRLSIVHNMVSCVRKYSEGFYCSLLEQFSSLLRDHVGDYCIDCYHSGKNLGCMHGEKIYQLIEMFPKIIEFLKLNFGHTPILLSLLKLLNGHPKTHKFIQTQVMLGQVTVYYLSHGDYQLN